jgi:glycosyltransferase involved in cell wall biosynthesis
MKISVIVTLYKDLISLGIVLDALRRQTYKEFEVIIAEDDDAQESIVFLKNYQDLNIVHLSQSDTGRNKVVIQNKAICKASGEYLFFIDGDIVPYKHFIEYSLKIAKKRQILSGRRVNLDEQTSKAVKDRSVNIDKIEKNFFLFLWKNRKNREARVEQGIELHPDSIIYKLLSKRTRNAEIIGCNFSCFKEDMIAINGFNEEYHQYVIFSEDTDLTWRFKGKGYVLKSSKNIANCFHLWHKTGTPVSFDPTKDLALFQSNKANKQYRCINGLDKYCK